jgi:hypothetical protein
LLRTETQRKIRGVNILASQLMVTIAQKDQIAELVASKQEPVARIAMEFAMVQSWASYFGSSTD